jgi:hypothetical protein
VITCQITNLSQDFDLNDGQQKTYAVLLLPTGKSLRVPVDDDTAASLIAIVLNGGGQAKRVAPSPDYQEPPAPKQELKIDPEVFLRGTAPDGTDTAVFGGMATPAEEALMKDVESRLGGGDDESELASAMKKAEANERLVGGRLRPRLVGVDSKGNPVMEYPNGVDPTKVTGGPSSNGDEDGVQQL